MTKDEFDFAAILIIALMIVVSVCLYSYGIPKGCLI